MYHMGLWSSGCKINKLVMMFESYSNYVSNKLYISRSICVDISPNVRIIFIFNFRSFWHEYAPLDESFIFFIFKCSNNLKRLFDLLCTVIGNPALFSCSPSHMKGITNNWNTTKLILLCQYIQLLIANDATAN